MMEAAAFVWWGGTFSVSAGKLPVQVMYACRIDPHQRKNFANDPVCIEARAKLPAEFKR
jgi:hypothetical protein